MIKGISDSTVLSGPTGVGLPTAGNVVPATMSSSGDDFASVLGKLMNDAVGVMQAGEETAIQGIKGTASPLGVVNAVMSAQQTLHTALSIRDKIVSAYQEIARMTI